MCTVVPTYTMHLQLHIFRLQYSIERICAAIGDNRTLRCPLYCKFGAKYSAHHPVYPMRTVVLDIYNVITAPHIQCFNIQLYVSALQLQISRQFNARYTAITVPNKPHILQFAQCELWSRPYTIQWQLNLVSLQCTADRIFAAVGDIPSFRCAVYSKFGTK
jgi:hypothetical protein